MKLRLRAAAVAVALLITVSGGPSAFAQKQGVFSGSTIGTVPRAPGSVFSFCFCGVSSSATADWNRRGGVVARGDVICLVSPQPVSFRH